MTNRDVFEAWYWSSWGAGEVGGTQALAFARDSRGQYLDQSVHEASVVWQAAVQSQRMTSVEMDGRTLLVVDWNELSRRGVLVRINEMLRAEGLAVMRVVETGTSLGAMVLEVSDGQ